SQNLDLHRLPELFCGFKRRPGEGPTSYPVACAPQAWAAASVFLLLQACLGLSIDVPKNELRFSHPALPPFLEEIQIQNLRVGAGVADLTLHRYPDDVGINVTRRTGDFEVRIIK
ncbi:MAG: amylo-alpha-1,6-glucosidase, partial [bacterium]